MYELQKKIFLIIFLVLFVILGIVGGLQLLLASRFTDSLYTGSEQSINFRLAENIGQRLEPYLNPKLNSRSAVEILNQIHDFNPRIRAYILDSHGVIQKSLQEGSPLRRLSVNLEPVELFLSSSPDEMPVMGDDPANREVPTIFSASRIRFDDRPGYLYVTLESNNFHNASSAIKNNYLLKNTAVIFLLSILGTTLVTLIIIMLARRRYRQVAELMAQFSHDLKSPLAVVQGYLETLILKGDSLPPDKQRAFLLRALRRIEKLSSFMRDMLDVPRIKNIRNSLTIERFDLFKVIQKVCAYHEEDARRKNILIECVTPEDLPEAEGDRNLMERAISNLIENAIRYSNNDGVVAITLDVANEKDASGHYETRLSVEIADTGIGIPKDEIKHIFDKFYRASNARSQVPAGSGLGLFIVREIIEAHGSELTIKSSEKTGTIVSFSIPTASRDARYFATYQRQRLQRVKQRLYANPAFSPD
ncbi:MAG: sensor histidine kinase [Candidatus Dadabacteria bacterium]|nr:MAG: sensor histidine kinase [Candidatus Dadabacteria bacterium]